MKQSGMRAAHLTVAFAWMAISVAPIGAHADRSRVRIALAEVAAVDGGAPAAQALSRAITAELGRTPELHVTAARTAQLVLRGSVVQFTRTRVARELEVRCEVSLIVADAGGSIRAMLRGRGGARGRGDEDRLAEDALGAAVRGALRPLASQSRALAR